MADKVNVESLRGRVLPSVLIKSITLKDSGSDSLFVNADFSLVDLVESGEINWINNSDFTKYLRIKATLKYYDGNVESEEDVREQIKEISVKKEDIDLRDSARTVLATGEELYQISYQASFEVEYSKEEIEGMVLFALVEMDVEQLGEDYDFDPSFLPTDRELGDLYAGNEVDERIFTAGKVNTTSYTFYLKDTNEVWAGPYIDKGQLEEPRRTTGEFVTNPLASPGGIPIDLRRVQVPNLKIKDLTQINILESGQEDIKPALEEPQKIIQKRKNRDQLRVDLQQPYASHCYISQGREGYVSLLFQIDLRKLVRNQSALGSIFETNLPETSKEEIYNLSTIKNLQILRRRVGAVQSIDKLGTKKRSFLFDSSRNIVENLITSSDNKDGKLEQKSKEGEAFLKEVENVSFSQDTRTFTATDYEIEKITDGYYQYGVSVEIIDGVIPFLNERLNLLLEAKKGFDSYYDDAMTPKFLLKDGNFNSLLPSKYQDPARPENQALWENAVQTYLDVYTDLSKDDYLGQESRDDLETILKALVSPESANEESLYGFEKIYSNLINHLEKGIGDKVPRNQTNTGSAKKQAGGKFKIGTLSTERFFEDIYDSNTPNNFGYDILGIESQQEEGIKTITSGDILSRATRENNIYWDVDNAESLAEISQDVQNIYSGSSFTNEQKEALFDLQQNELAYMTPANMYAGSFSIGRFRQNNQIWQNQKYNTFAATSISLSSDKSFSPYSFDTADAEPDFNARARAQEKAMNNIFGKLGIIVVDNDNPNIKQDFFTLVDTQSGETDDNDENGDYTIPAGNVFGRTDPVAAVSTSESDTDSEIEETRKQQELRVRNRENKIALCNLFANNLSVTDALSDSLSASKKSNFLRATTISIKEYDVDFSNNVVNRLLSPPPVAITGFGVESISQIPNQIRSLLFSKSRFVRNKWDSLGDPFKTAETVQMMRYNYATMVKVEVLQGYQKDKNGNNLILKPIFSPLTREILDNSSDGVLICKMTMYQNNTLGIIPNAAENMKIYDQTFILDVPAGAGA